MGLKLVCFVSASIGSCPVECLPHHALAYLQPFVDNLLVVFSDLKFTYDNHVTTEVSTKVIVNTRIMQRINYCWAMMSKHVLEINFATCYSVVFVMNG